MEKLTDDNSPQLTEPAPHRPVLDYFPAIGNRVSRFFSSREKMVEGMKTLAWVVPLTLLIWIYAEREQVVVPTSPNANGVSINIMSSDPSLYVEAADSPDLTPTVNLQLTGPQQAVNHVQNLLNMRIPHEKLTVDIKSAHLGRQSVNIVQGIQDLAIFKENGVTVQQSQPTELSVNVYKMGQREITVQIPTGITNLTADTQFSPTKVTVTGPDSLLTNDLKVFAKLEDYEQLKQPGQHTIQSVPLEFNPPQTKLTVLPGTVTVNAVVVASDVPYEIPDTVQIRLDVPPFTINRYEVVPTSGDLTIARIQVKGPQQGIDAIKNKTFAVKVHLAVEQSDVGKDSIIRKLIYDLPDGVHPTEEQNNFTVEFHLRER